VNSKKSWNRSDCWPGRVSDWILNFLLNLTKLQFRTHVDYKQPMVWEGPNKTTNLSQVVSVGAGTNIMGTSCGASGLTSILVEKDWNVVPSTPSELLRPVLCPFCALSLFLDLRL
jgi:hypothetical protein